MQVDELKIGNLVRYNGIIVKVDSIISPKPLKDKRFSGKWVLDLFDGAGVITSTIEDILPIKITPDLLLKLGFKDRISGIIFGKGFFQYSFEDHYLSFNDHIITAFDYIHELQNIYEVISRENLNLIKT